MSGHYRSVFAPGLFAGQVIVVTGGGSGIGRCTAHELASLGAHVVLLGRKPDKLQHVAGEIVADGGRCSFHSCDIRDEAAVQHAVQAIVVATNLTGGFLVARECYRQSMQAHGGAIVNMVADIWGSMPGMGHSGAARAGIVFLLSPAASFISGSVLRIDGARPQVRMGWGQVAAPHEVQQRDAVKPFGGFHRHEPPKVFR